MTLDQAVALSLLDDQLPKPGLTARLLSDDPELLELASSRLDEAREVRRRRGKGGDSRARRGMIRRSRRCSCAISDCPPVLWYRGDLTSLDVTDCRDCRIASGNAPWRWIPRRGWRAIWQRVA